VKCRGAADSKASGKRGRLAVAAAFASGARKAKKEQIKSIDKLRMHSSSEIVRIQYRQDRGGGAQFS
jgi:hypothetical protein